MGVEWAGDWRRPTRPLPTRKPAVMDVDAVAERFVAWCVNRGVRRVLLTSMHPTNRERFIYDAIGVHVYGENAARVFRRALRTRPVEPEHDRDTAPSGYDAHTTRQWEGDQ